MTPTPRKFATRVGAGRLDAVLALLLFGGTILYLAAFPLSLGSVDEGHTLLTAKRLLGGEVMYRDVFDISTPGWVMVMAAAFGAFGASLATARLTVAAIHGGAAALLFFACRALGVRRSLAWGCAFAYLVVCQPMFPLASYHWLATFLCIVLLVLCLRPAGGTTWAFVLGVDIGLLMAVHQQRGLSMGLGVAALIVALTIIRWFYGLPADRSTVWRQLGAFAAGVTVVVGSLMVALVATSGIQPVWD